MTAYNFTIDADKIDAELSDFPVGIKIDESDFFTDLDSDSWQYIHATVDDVECYVEVEVWDSDNDLAVLWVKVPTVSDSTDTVIKIEVTAVDNTATYVGETGDAAAQNVWDEDFAAVYHMSQDPSGGADCILDSTSNENHGTPNNAGDLHSYAGSLSNSLSFNALNCGIPCGNDSSLNGIKTISLNFYNVTGHVTKQYWAGLLCRYTANNNRLMVVTCPDTYGNRPALRDGTAKAVYPDNDYYDLEAWHHFAVTNDGSSQDLFIDGVLEEEGSQSIPTSTGDNGTLYLGTYNYNGNIFYGILDDSRLDEIHLSTVIRSAAWIKATYNVLADTLGSLSEATGGEEPPEPPVISAYNDLRFTMDNITARHGIGTPGPGYQLESVTDKHTLH